MRNTAVLAFVLAGVLLLWFAGSRPVNHEPPTPVAPPPEDAAANGTALAAGDPAEPAPLTGLAGTVLDASGAPAAGAAVTAVPLERTNATPAAGAVADATGAFRLPHLPDGLYALLARADGAGAGWLPFARAPAAGLTVRLAPAAGIAGRVVTPEGAPVAGAHVTADPEPGWRETMQALGRTDRWRLGAPLAVATTTDAEGRFALATLPPGRLSVTVEAADRVPARREGVVAPAADLLFVLDPGGALAVVVELAGEPPFPDVTFSLPALDLDRQAAASGGAATARFDGLPIGDLLVTADAPGFERGAARVRIEPAREAGPLRLLLFPGTPVTGRLTDRATGRPIAGAELGFGEVERTARGLGYGLDETARTDADGRFRLRLRRGEWAVQPQVPGYGLEIGEDDEADLFRVGAEPVVFDVALVAVAAPETAAAPPPPAGAGAVSGRVVDEAGAPVAGAAVAVADREAVTDGEGRFLVAGLPPGGHAVRYAAPGFAPAFAGPVVVRDGAVADAGELVLPRTGLTVSGGVTDVEDVPVAGARVTAWFSLPDGPGYSVATTTDREGRYVLSGPSVERARVGLQVAATGYRIERDELELDGPDECWFTLVRTARVIGRLRFPGPPPGRIDVFASRADGGWPRQIRIDFSPEAGTFELTGLDPGGWRIRLGAPGLAATPAREVAAEDGETADLGELVVTPGGAVAGRVTDGEGRPLAGVRVRDEDGTADATTDGEGRYRLPHVTPGPATIEFRFPPGTPADEAAAVTVTEGGTATLDVRLPR